MNTKELRKLRLCANMAKNQKLLIDDFPPDTVLKLLDALEVYQEALDYVKKMGTETTHIMCRQALARVDEILGGET